MGKKVYFIRHAESYFNYQIRKVRNFIKPSFWTQSVIKRDVDLSSVGNAQAIHLQIELSTSKFFKRNEIDLIVTSPLRRALMTTLALSRPFHFASLAKVGVGKPTKTIRSAFEAYRQNLLRYGKCFPAGEELLKEKAVHVPDNLFSAEGALNNYVCEDVKVPIVVCDLVRETRTHYSDFGTSAKKLSEEFHMLDFSHLDDHWWCSDLMKDPEMKKKITNGEDVSKQEKRRSYRARSSEFVDWLAKRPEQNILVVSHAYFIREVTGESKLHNGEMLCMELD